MMTETRKDWLLRQFTKANYALTWCDWYLHEGWQEEGKRGATLGLTHPYYVGRVTFRQPRHELAFNWALLRLMFRYRGYEGMRPIIVARRERLKAEINAG